MNNLVSVVTVVYNGEYFLEETIKSVLSQTYPYIEYIIIDGGSTDKSINIIKKYEKNISYWISEKDKGMYNALNKGFSITSGKIMTYLNSDDLFANNDVIENVVRFFKKTQADLVFGNTAYIDQYQNYLYSYKAVELPKKAIKFLQRVPFAQSSAFWTKELFQHIGEFDENLKLAADKKFFLQALLHPRFKYKKIDQTISKFRLHKDSLAATMQNLMKKERLYIDRELNFKKSFFPKLILEGYIKAINFRNIIQKKRQKWTKKIRS